MMRTREVRGGVVIEDGVTKPPEGCGTELKKLLARFFIVEKPGCSCNSMARKMDENGPQWCRDNIEAIADVMEKEAAKRKWPFVRFLARRFILSAIRAYELVSTVETNPNQ